MPRPPIYTHTHTSLSDVSDVFIGKNNSNIMHCVDIWENWWQNNDIRQPNKNCLSYFLERKKLDT